MSLGRQYTFFQMYSRKGNALFQCAPEIATPCCALRGQFPSPQEQIPQICSGESCTHPKPQSLSSKICLQKRTGTFNTSDSQSVIQRGFPLVLIQCCTTSKPLSFSPFCLSMESVPPLHGTTVCLSPIGLSCTLHLTLCPSNYRDSFSRSISCVFQVI